jgi:hypothetical protein
MLMLLIQIIGAIATAFIALTLLKKDWRTKNEAIRKEAVLVTKIIIAVTAVSVVNLGISYFQSQIDINKLEKDKKALEIANVNLSSDISKGPVKQTAPALSIKKQSLKRVINGPYPVNGSKQAPLFHFVMLSNRSLAGAIINKDNKPVYNLSVRITNYDGLLSCRTKEQKANLTASRCFISNTSYNPIINKLNAKSIYYLKLPQFNTRANNGRYVITLTFNKRNYYEQAVYSISRGQKLVQALRILAYEGNAMVSNTVVKNSDYELKAVNWNRGFPLPLSQPLKNF